MKRFYFILCVAGALCSAFGERVPIEQRVHTYDRDKNGAVDRRVTSYIKKGMLDRRIVEEDINYDGTFDSRIDTWYKGDLASSTYWENLSVGSQGRIFWHEGRQMMLEIDNDGDKFFEIRMFLDSETQTPIEVFDISPEGAARPVEKEQFKEYYDTFVKKKPLIESAIRDYSKSQKRSAQVRAEAEKKRAEEGEAEKTE